MSTYPDIRPHWPKAALTQLHRDEDEWRLCAVARVTHPRVIWWHGTKQSPVKFGAYCYLCEDYITTWARTFPITGKAKVEIDHHRRWHLDQLEVTSHV